ncbi:two-component sensor histidine kinase [Streptomyces globosus]|uniref:Two-component sensor histidine kinase n=1 Tax=Streptomyces globosus TaxID=68209 RepID=A0A344TXG3_9ACTN|nr:MULTISPECIES: histidine kinase [Streptomyces]AXE23334.1 two-component sensor histidine kinase [Streptomyces globosus]
MSGRLKSSDDASEAVLFEGILRRSRDLPAPRMAKVTVVVALLCYVGITTLNVLGAGVEGPALAAALFCLAAVFGLQLLHSRAGAKQAPAARRALTLGAQAALTYLPLLALKSQWGAMAGFLAGSLLLLLPPRLGWSLYGFVGVSMLVPPLLDGRPVLDSVYLVQTTLLTGLVTFGLTRLSELVHVLHESRDELTRAAVTRERLRFARDLHDLLGYSLSAIQLKGELIHRLIPAHPAKAKKEIEDILAISRQSLADVRRVASGYRDLSLEEEIASARSVLSAAEVEAVTDVRMGKVSAPVDTVLATVLREAVTNVLRHSRAAYCEITAVEEDGLMTLSVTNDGVTDGYRDSSPHSGSGLGNLGLRLQAVGGELEVDRRPGNVFRVVARVPAQGAVDLDLEGSPEGERTWLVA